MSDTYEKDPQVRAEMAVTELRRAWLEVLQIWPMVMRDSSLLDDLRAIRGGIEMKLSRKAA